MGLIFSSDKEGIVFVENPYISPENVLIIQVTRKLLLLNEFNNYIKNANNTSIYFKHILGTISVESCGEYIRKTKLISNVFFVICEIDVYENINNYFLFD